jgi:FkbM family methyltransferase
MAPGGVFVDIGANVGFFSVKIASHCGPDCRTLAIEPNPVTLARLRFNVQSLKDRITVIGKAIGRTAGTARFHSSGSNLGESRFDAAGEIEVAVEPLLDIVSALGVTRIDALKIDVEGYEDAALMPFFETAPKSLWPQRLVLEYTAQSNWKQDCLAYLLANGYRQHSKTRGNALLVLDLGHDAHAPGGRPI